MSEYEGGECQQKHAAQEVKLNTPKHDCKITFFNEDGDEVGTLDFSGHGLSFEGVADIGAIMFMEQISKVFQSRLKEEYDKGYKAGKTSQNPK
jgi:hypothetical protein